MEIPPAGFLAALQLADSFFPSGLYSHSQGLEGLIRRGLVQYPDDVAEFLRNQLAWSLLPADGVALLNAHPAAAARDLPTLIAIDRLLAALKLPEELRNASAQAGRRLLAETASFTADPTLAAYRAAVTRREAPGNGAAALGVVAAALEIPAEAALLAFCHSHAVSVLGAALRLLRFSHSQGQQILRQLHPLMATGAASIAGRGWRDMAAFTPQLDFAAMRHENDELRLFAS